MSYYYSPFQLDNAVNTDEVDEIIDIPVNSSIIKTSGWSIIEPITHANRYQLIQYLVQDEVITKRESNIKAFFNGLNMLKVGDLLLSHPDTMMSLFVFESEQLTAYSFVIGGISTT